MSQFVVKPKKQRSNSKILKNNHLSIGTNFQQGDSHSWKSMYNSPPDVHRDIDNASSDWISHHILRLAFAKNEQLKQWFLTNELLLFECRLENDSDAYIDILQRNGIKAEEVSLKEKTELDSDLYKMYVKHTIITNYSQKQQNEVQKNNIPKYNKDTTTVYKVNFTDVLQLVATRNCFIRNGYAYLFIHDLVSLLKQFYRGQLVTNLNKIQNTYLHYLQEEESDRLLPFLRDVLPAASEGKSLTNNANFYLNSGDVHPEQIDSLSRQSFPLCMRVLHKELKEKHHLKHYGRMQYGLFLKGIGLKLEDALQFWKDQFTTNGSMTLKTFEQEYAYNIRHNYGKEGKRTNYAPYGCAKIINNPEYVCPFKHFSSNELLSEMKSYAGGNTFNDEDLNEVVELARGHNYQVACRRFFEISHQLKKNTNNIVQLMDNEDDGTPFSHPNRYFSKSIKYLKKTTMQQQSNNNNDNNNQSTTNQDASLKKNEEEEHLIEYMQDDDQI
ncbi:hypothetical protein ABK040_008863 [Willaertia magna]